MNVNSILNTQPNFKGRIYIKNANRISTFGNVECARTPVKEIFLDSRNICSIEKSNITPSTGNVFQEAKSTINEAKEAAASIFRIKDGSILEVAGNHTLWSHIKAVADWDCDTWGERPVYFLTKDEKLAMLFPDKTGPDSLVIKELNINMDPLKNAQ